MKSAERFFVALECNWSKSQICRSMTRKILFTLLLCHNTRSEKIFSETKIYCFPATSNAFLLRNRKNTNEQLQNSPKYKKRKRTITKLPQVKKMQTNNYKTPPSTKKRKWTITKLPQVKKWKWTVIKFPRTKKQIQMTIQTIIR